MDSGTWIFVSAIVIFVLFKSLNRTDIPKIKGLAEIPGIPVFGNLLQLGEEHARRTAELSMIHGPVFQVRLGNRRIVFVNTFDAVRHFWISYQSSLISRPTLHTFERVSSSQGFTIGTSPWDESCKRRRKAAATALNRPAVQSYMPIIDEESTLSITELIRDSDNGGIDIDPIHYWQRFALNTSLTLNYGYRLEGTVGDELLQEIFHVEREVSNFRSTSNNWQDYLPILRLALWSNRNRGAEEYRKRRDRYMSLLLNILKQNIARGEDKPASETLLSNSKDGMSCLSNVLKDPEAKLNEAELKSICLTMVSAGLDTVPGNIIMGLALLASQDGQRIQERAHQELMKAYPEGNAWYKVIEEEKVEYVTAFVKEVLRFWTVIPICLPRMSIKDVPYESAIIPAGTTFFMNAHAADFDSSHFADPRSFSPERFLPPSPHASSGTPHLAYGAGSRMCAGSHLANRELYVAFARIVISMRLSEAKDPRDRPLLDPLECNANKTSLTTDPKPFKIGLRLRSGAENWIYSK